jgi:hypothetical protein
MLEKMPPARPISVGSWKRKAGVTWGRPLTEISTMIKTRISRVKPVRAHSRALTRRWVRWGSSRTSFMPFCLSFQLNQIAKTLIFFFYSLYSLQKVSFHPPLTLTLSPAGGRGDKRKEIPTNARSETQNLT